MAQKNQSHDLADHTAFNRTFQPDQLSIGFISPACGYPDSAFPSLADQAEIVQRLDQSDAAALWLRDVPFYDPSFGDTGQVLDPLVYAGWLAALTGRIAIGTAGIVSPLREPIITAKQIPEAVPHWREVTSSRGFVPFGYGAMFDLDTNAHAPLQTGRVLRGGRHALKDFFARQQEAGINHVALNLKPTRRPALEVIDELQEHILPAFTVDSAR